MEAGKVGRRKTFLTVRSVPEKTTEAGSAGALKAFCAIWVLICFAPLCFQGRLRPRHLGASFFPDPFAERKGHEMTLPSGCRFHSASSQSCCFADAWDQYFNEYCESNGLDVVTVDVKRP